MAFTIAVSMVLILDNDILAFTGPCVKDCLGRFDEADAVDGRMPGRTPDAGAMQMTDRMQNDGRMQTTGLTPMPSSGMQRRRPLVPSWEFHVSSNLKL